MANVRISDLTSGGAAAAGDVIEIERSGSKKATLGGAAGLSVGTATGTVAAGDHTHALPAGLAELLTQNRTYYVNASTGSDSNDGLSLDEAFATIQKAADVVSGINFGNFIVTIQIADGTYEEDVYWSGAGYKGFGPDSALKIVGNILTPGNVIIDGPSSGPFTFERTPVEVHISGLKLTGGVTALGVGMGAWVALGVTGPVIFGDCSLAHIFVAWGGLVAIWDDYTIAGDTEFHFYATQGGIVSNIAITPTITLTGTPEFATVFAYAEGSGSEIDLDLAGTGPTFSGSAAAGDRWLVDTNASITAGGATLPGDMDGTETNGGVYVA